MKHHHLVSDGWSSGLIARQIIDFYNDLKKGKPVSACKNTSYTEFIEIENNYLVSERFKKDKEYWEKEFPCMPEPIDLKPDCISTGIEIERKLFKFPPDFSLEVYRFCEEYKTSVFRLFLSAFSIYAHRLTGKEELVFGTAFSNRLEGKLKHAVGMFCTSLPFKITMNRDTEFESLLKQINEKLKFAKRHQRYPCNLLFRDLGKTGKPEKHKDIYYPSIEFIQIPRNCYPSDIEGDWCLNTHSADYLGFYLGYTSFYENTPIELNIEYQTEKFSSEEISLLFNNLLDIIKNILKNSRKSSINLKVGDYFP